MTLDLETSPEVKSRQEDLMSRTDSILFKIKRSQGIKHIIDEVLGDLSEETVVYPDLEEALVGVVSRFGQADIACYDYQKVIEIYIQQGMSREEAVEYFEYNTLGSWLGETTPCFIRKEP